MMVRVELSTMCNVQCVRHCGEDVCCSVVFGTLSDTQHTNQPDTLTGQIKYQAPKTHKPSWTRIPHEYV